MSERMRYRPCHGYVAECSCGWRQHHTDLSNVHCDGMEHMLVAHGAETAGEEA